jgi:hypothetical protein
MVGYREDYDNIVAQVMFRKHKSGENKSGEYSATDIYDIIRRYGKHRNKKRMPGRAPRREKAPGKDTVQRHINRMIEENMLILSRKGGLFNKTLYKLSPRVIAFFNKREF